jgi:hypothetical protein
MVVPVNPLFTGRGKTPLEPQFFYTIPGPILTPPPFNQKDWPLPPAYAVQAQRAVDYTWTSNNYILPFRPPTPDVTKIFRPHLRSLPDQPYPPNAFQSWTWNQTIRLQAAPPVGIMPGEPVMDLPPAHYRLPDQVQLHSWISNYNLNLIGKDRLPAGVMPGEPSYDLTPRPYEPWPLRSWAYNLTIYIQPLVVQRPFNQFDWPAPRAPLQPQFWTQPYNLNLYAAGPAPDLTKIFRPIMRSLPDQPVQQPIRDSVFPAYAALYTVPAALVPRNQYDWPVPRAPQQPAASWTASYNLNLIGQDKLPAGKIITDRPTLAPVPAALSWTFSFSLPLNAQPFFTINFDWPVPRAPQQGALGMTWRQVDKIGYDQMVTGEQLTDLPPRDFQRLFQTFIQTANPATYPINFPANQYDWPVPKAPLQPALSWTASYNLNLIGQDQKPPGQQFTELPPRDFARLFQTWINFVSLALVTAPPDLTKQARQQDWPLPGAYPRPDDTWISRYNLSLVGQDQLPVRQQDWPLSYAPQRPNELLTFIHRSDFLIQKPTAQYDWPVPKAAQQPAQSYTSSYDLSLIGQDSLPNRQQDWPLSSAYVPRLLQTWIEQTNIALYFTAPPTPPPQPVFCNGLMTTRPANPILAPPDTFTIINRPFVPPVVPPTTGALDNPTFLTTMGRNLVWLPDFSGT